IGLSPARQLVRALDQLGETPTGRQARKDMAQGVKQVTRTPLERGFSMEDGRMQLDPLVDIDVDTLVREMAHESWHAVTSDPIRAEAAAGRLTRDQYIAQMVGGEANAVLRELQIRFQGEAATGEMQYWGLWDRRFLARHQEEYGKATAAGLDPAAATAMATR